MIEPMLSALISAILTFCAIGWILLKLEDYWDKRWFQIPILLGLIIVMVWSGWKVANYTARASNKNITIVAEREWRQSEPTQTVFYDEMQSRKNRCPLCGGPAVETVKRVIVRKNATEEDIRWEADRGGTPITYACDLHTEWLQLVKYYERTAAAEYFRTHYQGAITSIQLSSISDADLLRRFFRITLMTIDGHEGYS